MNASLRSGRFPLYGRSIALAVTLAILMPIAPHEALAKGGVFSSLDRLVACFASRGWDRRPYFTARVKDRTS
jgi:hypothetical protein